MHVSVSLYLVLDLIHSCDQARGNTTQQPAARAQGGAMQLARSIATVLSSPLSRRACCQHCTRGRRLMAVGLLATLRTALPHCPHVHSQLGLSFSFSRQIQAHAGGTADTTINHAMQITAAGSAMTRTYRICAHPSLSTLCL